jgi:AcrR family transcriptional regulator
MSPRPYHRGRRQIATDETRARIVTAARELLADPRATAFTIDAVAEGADVARMTVYYQFKSKGGVLQAVFDDFGAQANMRQLRSAFQELDVQKALDILIETFCRLWHTQGGLLRRLNALAVLDPEVNDAMMERGSWRREAIAQIVQRLQIQHGADELVDLLHMLTTFEAYDTLAARNRPRQQIISMLQTTAHGMVLAAQLRGSSP